MTALIMKFNPDHFYPVPEGTILKYIGHWQNYDSKEWTVTCEVIGWPDERMKIQVPVEIPGYDKS